MFNDWGMDKENVVLVHICSTILFRLKKKGILSYDTKWMKQDYIPLNEISQSQKEKYCTFHIWEVSIVTYSEKVELWLPWAGHRAVAIQWIQSFCFAKKKKKKILEICCMLKNSSDEIVKSRWRRNRTGRSLSLLQIHWKNNRTVNKVYKTTSDR